MCHVNDHSENQPLLKLLALSNQTARAARTVVHSDDVQAVKELALVFVDPLHVDVKHGGWVDFHWVLLLQVLGKFHLVVL